MAQDRRQYDRPGTIDPFALYQASASFKTMKQFELAQTGRLPNRTGAMIKQIYTSPGLTAAEQGDLLHFLTDATGLHCLSKLGADTQVWLGNDHALVFKVFDIRLALWLGRAGQCRALRSVPAGPAGAGVSGKR
jgi:hypothetical protein